MKGIPIMTQHSRSSSTPPPSTPPSSRKGLMIMRWLGLILLISAFVAGIIGYLTKLDIIPTILLFVSAFAALIVAILQINKNAFSFVWQERTLVIQIIGTVVLIASLAMNAYLLILPMIFSAPSAHPIMSPSPTAHVKTTGLTTTTSQPSASSNHQVSSPSYFDPSSSGSTQMEH